MNKTAIQNAGSLTSFNFGNGLVEIGALTTLIGSNTAGDIVLGNRGPAGLVWGSITTFGNSSVIKACAGAASPGWLRHILGLRTTASDAAAGIDLPLDASKFAQSVRSTGLHVPLGVLCNSKESNLRDKTDVACTAKDNLPFRDVYAFDRVTSVMLDELTATSIGNPLVVHTFHSYDYFLIHNMRFQTAVLGLSLLKFFEIYFLFVYGGALMGFLSAIPFCFSFLVATVAEIHDIAASRRPMDVDGRIDLVVGTLPTTKQVGGPRKVILGSMKNPKINIWWRAYWAINALLQTLSLLIYYLLLGQQGAAIVVIWAGFQITWVILRTVIFHLVDSTEPMMYRRMRRHELNDLTPSMKMRVVNLVGAVGTYQMHIHPRGIQNHKDDTFSSSQISKLLATSNMGELYELPKDYSSPDIQLNVVAIIGDTLLSSAAWIAGLDLTPMDLYDSCIVVLSEPPQSGGQLPRIISIPAARVFSSTRSTVTDSECAQPEFIPRGAGQNLGDDKKVWIYWIPCQSGRWMQIRSKNQSVLGQISADVMGDKELTQTLRAGNLNISLTCVEDIKAIVEVSHKATNSLLVLGGFTLVSQ